MLVTKEIRVEPSGFIVTGSSIYLEEAEAKAPKPIEEKEKMAEEKVDFSQWLKRGTSTFIPTDNAKTVEEIEPGVYNLRHSQNIGFYLYKKELKLDELYDLESDGSKEVLESIKTFWERKDKFKEYGFVYKRGLLLYGPPGSGKTSLINLLADILIKEHDGVVFILQSRNDLNLYRDCIPEIFRVIEPNRPIITVVEDIDGLCAYQETETTLINILDGIEQLENVIYLATTNFPEKLSSRILNRPNRFDRRIHIGFPSEKTRWNYIKNKLKPTDLNTIDRKEWLRETEGMTIAHIGELIKSVIILGNGFTETITRLRALKNIPSSYDFEKNNKKKSIGFGQKDDSNNYEDEDLSEAIDNDLPEGYIEFFDHEGQ